MLRTNLQQVGSQYWKQLSLLGKQVRMTYQGEQSMASLKCRQMRRRKSPGQISSKGRPAASWHWLYVGESRPPGLRLVREVSGRDLTKSGGLLGDRSHLPRSVPAEAKILERACSFFSVSFSIKRLSYKWFYIKFYLARRQTTCASERTVKSHISYMWWCQSWCEYVRRVNGVCCKVCQRVERELEGGPEKLGKTMKRREHGFIFSKKGWNSVKKDDDEELNSVSPLQLPAHIYSKFDPCIIQSQDSPVLRVICNFEVCLAIQHQTRTLSDHPKMGTRKKGTMIAKKQEYKLGLPEDLTWGLPAKPILYICLFKSNSKRSRLNHKSAISL